MAPSNYQTTRLGVGRHDGPGEVVCVMELASMLAGERFSDRPVAVCPIVGAILRAYNDSIDDRRRHDLYRYAAEAVGTRRDFATQRRRAALALEWARLRYEQRPGRLRGLRVPPAKPRSDDGPDEIAFYVVRALGRKHSEATHLELLRLMDELIGIGVERSQPPVAVEPRPAREPLPTARGRASFVLGPLEPAELEPMPWDRPRRSGRTSLVRC